MDGVEKEDKVILQHIGYIFCETEYTVLCPLRCSTVDIVTYMHMSMLAFRCHLLSSIIIYNQ